MRGRDAPDAGAPPALAGPDPGSGEPPDVPGPAESTDAGTVPADDGRARRPRRAGARRQLGLRVTPGEDDLLRRERDATGARSLAAVLERALLALLADEDRLARDGLAIPGARVPGREALPREGMLARLFRPAPATLDRLDAFAARHGWSRQAIVRAALHRLAGADADRDRARAGACPGKGGGPGTTDAGPDPAVPPGRAGR